MTKEEFAEKAKVPKSEQKRGRYAVAIYLILSGEWQDNQAVSRGVTDGGVPRSTDEVSSILHSLTKGVNWMPYFESRSTSERRNKYEYRYRPGSGFPECLTRDNDSPVTTDYSASSALKSIVNR